MKVNRRQFLQSTFLAGAGLMISPGKTTGDRKASSLFGIHPFILQNPDAVFVMRTNIDLKTNSAAIKKAGLDFGRSVFGLTDDATNGIPLTHKVVIKPNLTCRSRGSTGYTIEKSMGIVTDAFFVEGIIESLKDLGITSGQFYIREVNCPGDLADGGYLNMAARTGIDIQGIDTPVQNLSPDKVQWVDVPDGVFFRRIPYLWPVNAPDTFLLNIAKFKAHGMGLTLCAKNLQGTIAMNYQAHCTSYGEMMSGVSSSDLNPTANADILENYNHHKAAGIPRWDKPGSAGGLWQETWVTRCLDNNSVTFAGLHIIEGIYGRDGNFMVGPGQDGLPTDYMTNYIIFGRNQFHVDNIGHYLGGHEPGNFGLFHLAKKRLMASTINPAEIPFYEWNPETGAVATNLSGFQRYPLKTYYLQRNYNGQNEPYWHMVDEYYDYGATAVNDMSTAASGLVLYQNFPNPVQNLTSIGFQVPGSGDVCIEVLNGNGKIIDIPLKTRMGGGSHMVNWNSSKAPSGSYFYRIHFGGLIRTKQMIVIH
jgi:hypothetical protein